MNVRKQDMGQWYCNTRRCSSLAAAMDYVLTLYSTSNISIWQISDCWLVVMHRSALVN